MSTSLSLVTIVHHRSPHLPTVIEGILTQTYSQFELFIWDAGLTDDALEVAHHYAQQDARIRLIAAVHRGRSLPLRSVLAATSGRTVGWMASDILLSPTALEELAIVLTHCPAVGLVYPNVIGVDRTPPVSADRSQDEPLATHESRGSNRSSPQLWLLRRTIAQRVATANGSIDLAQASDVAVKVSGLTQIVHLKRSLYFECLPQSHLTHQYQVQDSWLHPAPPLLPVAVVPEEFTAWALPPATLVWLTQFIATQDIHAIVECGSGLSTLLFASLNLKRVLSLEHDAAWYSYTQQRLQAKQLGDRVDLRLCPLQQMELSAVPVKWYDLKDIEPFPTDLILVDGPPSIRDYWARYPAPHLLKAFIRAGTWLLLDDYYRVQEMKIVSHWLRELPQLKLKQVLPEKHGLAVLQFYDPLL